MEQHGYFWAGHCARPARALAILVVGRGGAAVTAGMGLLFAGAGVVWLAIAAPRPG